MKRAVILAAILILLAAMANAQTYDEAAIDADTTAPVIEELEIYTIADRVNELSWWVSDDVQLNRYEVYKDGTIIKTKSIGGIRQSSKFRDLQAWDDPTYTFIVYDVAGHSTERNISMNVELDKEKIAQAIEEAMPEEEQLVVVADPEPAVEDPITAPVDAEEAVEEEPAKRSNAWLAAVIVLIILAVFWKLLGLQPKETTHKHKRYKDIGMHDYMHKRKTKKK